MLPEIGEVEEKETRKGSNEKPSSHVSFRVIADSAEKTLHYYRLEFHRTQSAKFIFIKKSNEKSFSNPLNQLFTLNKEKCIKIEILFF